jgi:hypothetical protein
MKQKAINIGCIVILVSVVAGCVAVITYMLIRWTRDIWQFFVEPGLSLRLTEMTRGFLETSVSLGLCCVGVIILIIIIGNIPYKWWHGGMESSGDEDDDPYYRYM